MTLALAHPLADASLQAHYEAARALRAADDPAAGGDEDWGRDRIFVSVAAFRDPECHRTVAELFEKAAHPERIHVGLIWQLDAQADAAYLEPPLPRRGQIRELRFDWREGLGVTWARFLAQALWRGEEYFLQIDSHMKFEEGWDRILVEDLRGLPSQKPIIGVVPPPYLTPGDVVCDLYPGILRPDAFIEDGTIRVSGVWLASPLERAVPMPYFLAGGLFAPARFIAEVPYDPYGCFATEEILHALRAFTHGWDVFAAPRRPFWHQYKRDNRIKRGEGRDPRFEERIGAWTRAALLRYGQLTGQGKLPDDALPPDLDLFGLGSTRTLGAFEAFTGIDFRFRRVTEEGLRARYHEDAIGVAEFVVPGLDDATRTRPAMVDETEMLLRAALSEWEPERLASELTDLVIELDRHSRARRGEPPHAPLQPERERLLADFRRWDAYGLACELAKLSFAVQRLNEAEGAQEEQPARRAGA